MNHKISKNILIKKASGDEELFRADKLEHSLLNAGAKPETVLKIVADIRDWIYPGVSTKKIYHRAFSILHRERTSLSIRYKLKQAIFSLGPSGYPFENLIGQIFHRQGYSTEVGVVVDGFSVTHEMDVIATRDPEQHLVECKYHKDQGKQVSIQVPLYVRSRVNDIIRKRERIDEYQDFSFSGWVVTNTRFSSDSIQYGKCNDLNLMAWDYPSDKGLKNVIESLNIYPLTVLHNLTVRGKKDLLDQGIITCRQLLENIDLLSQFELSKPKYNALLKELNEICS